MQSMTASHNSSQTKTKIAAWKDQLTGYNGKGTFAYDANGNPLSYYNGSQYTFTWKDGRRLATASALGGYLSMSYSYNADGIRVSKNVNDVRHEYYLDGSRIIKETWADQTLEFLYDENNSVYCIVYTGGDGAGRYYLIKNLQGDVTRILNNNLETVAQYVYDPWGKLVYILDADGEPNSGISIANINPIRYRGYYFDMETGFYYVSSRYYDPEIGRWINADGYVSTGQGVLGNNMFAYCGNNPVNNCDPSGQFFISALLVGGLVLGSALLLSGCSAKPEPKPEPYKSADDAARAFSEQVYSSSAYIRHEYSTEIYSRTVKGETTYNYNPPRAGKPHSASVGNSTPKGTKAVAYAHTHPNSNVFSGADIRAAENLKIDAYVVGPNLELQRYSLSSASTTNIGGISPIALTDAQRSSLVTEFQVSWDAHIAAGCDFDCGSMTWPTP